MKSFTFLLLALFALVFIAAPLPATSAGGGSSGGIDTVPHTAPDVIGESTTSPESKPKKKKVKKGKSYTNGDEVTVTNDEDSNGDITIDPAGGDKNSKTTCKSTTNFVGSISGIDGNDVVMLSSSNTASVSGVGGSISLSGGSSVTITNGLGGGNMTCFLPSGGYMIIAPGSSVFVTT